MNHSERIAYTARQHRNLTRKLVKDAVETYLAQLAKDIADGEWVEIYGIGKIQVVKEQGAGILFVRKTKGQPVATKVGLRLRCKVRLSQEFKDKCRRQDK